MDGATEKRSEMENMLDKIFLFQGICFCCHIETRDWRSLVKFEQLEAAELKFNLIGENPK